VFRKQVDGNWLPVDSVGSETIYIQSIEVNLRIEDIYRNVSFLEDERLGRGG
jgi:hypothetical protein